MVRKWFSRSVYTRVWASPSFHYICIIFSISKITYRHLPRGVVMKRWREYSREISLSLPLTCFINFLIYIFAAHRGCARVHAFMHTPLYYALAHAVRGIIIIIKSRGISAIHDFTCTASRFVSRSWLLARRDARRLRKRKFGDYVQSTR